MNYDAIIIGSGQGGGPLARALAKDGKSVALIEKSHLGGTCINTGCTPTKTMLASAQVAHYVRNADRWGVRTSGMQVDLAAILARKNKITGEFRRGQEKSAAGTKGMRVYRGVARFASAHVVRVGDETLESANIFIDTGTRPSIPQIAGLEAAGYLTNETLMELTEVPEHLIVLGGGYIGLEFGQMFRRFGSRVTVIHHSGQILPREDREIAEALQKALEQEGIEFVLNAKATGVSGKIAVEYVLDGRTVSIAGSHLLVATGRTPNVEDLDLAKAGVATDDRGFIKVNERLETNVAGIWAMGDVNGGPAFTHISYNDYQIVYANLTSANQRTTAGRMVPYAVFTDPQLGGVGWTEKEAREKGYRLKIGKVEMTHVARAIERDETAGIMKIVVDASTDRILGASILSSEGGELVQILGTMMLAGQPYTLLKDAIYIHPTLAEGFFALMDDVKAVG